MNKRLKEVLVHGGLFVVTFITTTLAGSFWVNSRILLFTPYEWSDFMAGMQYSVPFLLILTVHEFGHYFTARYHKIKTSLPYYIPLPPLPGFIGTMGALIRIREFVKSKKQNFDIGLSGPIAGFVIAIGVLVYGFTHLPEKDHIYEIHPEYAPFGENYEEVVYVKDTFVLKNTVESMTGRDMSMYADTIRFNSPEQEGLSVQLGSNVIFWAFEKMLVDDPEKMPDSRELMHYPFLFAGFLALLFTALNLLPVGQLDGGHVLYGLIGAKWHRIVAQIVFVGFVFYAGIGLITPSSQVDPLFGLDQSTSFFLWMGLYVFFINLVFKGLKLNPVTTWMITLIVFTVQFTLPMVFPTIEGYSGWLLFAFIIGRFLGVYHPPVMVEEPLDKKRIILGWIALIIFIISFSPAPIIMS
ncbi:site-2 protease family protein [Fulvivirga sp. RKSG066]|uniref:site-2 protease family protein n=1 Tax=Fulvivirga aurantia TaxID=2529383 RepID=UPI0012BB52C0|nr:site-2 protease family protein [Fulvivirga aurantia]MTI19817.1 site-2 protease family protein [Fulvivirga aurantia]